MYTVYSRLSSHLFSDNKGLTLGAMFATPVFLMAGTVVGSLMSHRRRRRVTMVPVTSIDRNGGTLGLAGLF